MSIEYFEELDKTTYGVGGVVYAYRWIVHFVNRLTNFTLEMFLVALFPEVFL